jgi:hypothetical protein
VAVIVHDEASVQRLIKSVENWCAKNYMALNKTKYSVMFLAGQSTLSAWELREKNIAGVPHIITLVCIYIKTCNLQLN